jgi:hypothetical protein
MLTANPAAAHLVVEHLPDRRLRASGFELKANKSFVDARKYRRASRAAKAKVTQ